MTKQQTQNCNGESDAEERSGIPSNHLAIWKQKWKIISLIEIFTRNDLKSSFLELLQVKINSIQGEADVVQLEELHTEWTLGRLVARQIQDRHFYLNWSQHSVFFWCNKEGEAGR